MKSLQVAAAKKLQALKKAKKTSTFNVANFLFEEQLRFVNDNSPNKIAMCSRRSGKTVSCAADLVRTALETPGVVCLYITLSRNNAKKIIWRDLKKINRDYELKGEENLSELSITFPNQSIIYLSGAKDTNEIEKFRGLALKLVYIDEAQSFREYIKELINDIISPALMDYAGTLCMIGTPPPVLTGYFYDAFTTTRGGWSKHSWTFWNNPHITKKSKMTHAQTLERELSRRGVPETDPSIQREYFGRCVSDTDSLLIKYDPYKNNYDNINPHEKYNYVLGIDIGHDDADALAVLAWNERSPNVYLVEEALCKGQDITDLMNMIENMRKKYDISKMVIDTGGLGKKITEELIRRYHIPLEPADKARKMENVALLNTYLQTGRLKAKTTSDFAKDSYLVEIDKDKSTADKIKVSDKYHSDIIDAVLYAFKICYAYTYQPEVKGPKYGSKEWADQQEDIMFESEMERLTKEAEQFKLNNEDPFNFDQ